MDGFSARAVILHSAQIQSPNLQFTSSNYVVVNPDLS